MSHIKHLSIMADTDLQPAFEKWCEAVGYNSENGELALLELPDKVALALLKIYKDSK